MSVVCLADARLLLPHTLRSAAGQPFRKVPRLLALVASISLAPSGDAFAQLKDPEGRMGAALHRDVLEAVGAQLGPRAVLLLQQVGVAAHSCAWGRWLTVSITGAQSRA